jgi:alcohol dehydrogenase, propanol-preferring
VKALQITGWKQPPELRQIDEPEPGPGEVIIRIGGAGACHSDLHLLHDFDEGMMPFEMPFTLGHENAGWVDAVGTGVVGLEIGMPVAVYGAWGCGYCPRCRVGMENYCDNAASIPYMGGGLGTHGGMAERMLVPSGRLLVPLGDLSPVQAAPLTDAGLTPYHAIARSQHLLTPGSTTVVIGAGGGLGHMAVQILAATTATDIVAVDTSADGLALATNVGASHGVLAGADAAAEISEITRGRGAELVLDFVGVDDTLALSVASSRSLGHVTLVGIGGGSHAFNFFSQPYEVSFATTYWGSISELAQVLALAEAGHIRAHIEQVPLSEATNAYDRLAAGELHGRAVIVP